MQFFADSGRVFFQYLQKGLFERDPINCDSVFKKRAPKNCGPNCKSLLCKKEHLQIAIKITQLRSNNCAYLISMQKIVTIYRGRKLCAILRCGLQKKLQVCLYLMLLRYFWRLQKCFSTQERLSRHFLCFRVF